MKIYFFMVFGVFGLLLENQRPEIRVLNNVDNFITPFTVSIENSEELVYEYDVIAECYLVPKEVEIKQKIQICEKTQKVDF